MKPIWRHNLIPALWILCGLFQAVGYAQVEFRKPTWQDINGRRPPDNLNSSDRSPDSDRSPVGRVGDPNAAPDNQQSSTQTKADLVSSSKVTQPSAAKMPQPIVTRQNSFGVPFTVNTDSGPIREVQLHVSSNRGATWALYSRQLPTAREFPFRASTDGEYWFAVKTVGSTIGETALQPELIISIDSRRPNFNVSLKTDALGRLVVSWRATDENLDPKSVKISYQSVSAWGRSGGGWQEVRLPQPDPSVKSVYQDEVAFYADTNNVSLDVRISIADRAGNTTEVKRRFNLPRTAQNRIRPAQQLNVATRTGSGQVGGSGRMNSRPAESGFRPPSTDPYSSFTQQDKDDAAQKVGLTSGFDQNNAPGPPPANTKFASSENRQQGWQVQGNSGFAQDFYNNQTGGRLASGKQASGSGNNQSRDFGPSSVSDPGFQSPNRLASSKRSLNETEEAFHRGSNVNRIPSGQYAKLSSSKKFELDYQVEHIQPDNISRLEIWVTEDAGQTWSLQTTDPDRQSPVSLEVSDDGIYGYRLRIQTVDGLESMQPSSGDSADVWVEVDTTRPGVRLKSIPYGRRSDAGKLIVNWEATDRRLAAKPITLFYSVNLDGPWQIIVEKLENTGQFKWPVTDRIPRNVYLRIEAVDAAGNKNYHQTEQPIDLSGLNPRGMIRGVRPIK